LDPKLKWYKKLFCYNPRDTPNRLHGRAGVGPIFSLGVSGPRQAHFVHGGGN